MAEGKHLRVLASASNERVRSGRRISLVLNMQLEPRLHVYAPGVQGDYIPIEWNMKESAALTVHAATYPRSRLLRLEAIKETVPVYQDTFRLVRDVTVARDPALRLLLDAEGKLNIEGALELAGGRARPRARGRRVAAQGEVAGGWLAMQRDCGFRATFLRSEDCGEEGR